MANKDEYERAITAVRNGVADRRQEELAKKAASQAGSMGNRAREAFRGK